MRIIHVITRLIVGGAQENTLYNVIDLAALGDEVTLITGPAEGPEGDLFEQARAHNVDLVLMETLRRAIHPRDDWRAYRALCREFRHRQPDVVHTHSSKAGILGRLAARRCRVPAIVHTIHGLPFHPYERWYRNWPYIAAERCCARITDRLISVADAMTEQALAASVGHPDQYVTIYSGMEVDTFLAADAKRAEVRQSLGYGPEDVVIGKIARLFELKGHDDVIDAARLVVNRIPAVRFLFVGGGHWRQRLEERVREEGLADHFQFLGLVPPTRIPELLGATDIIVHASYREGLARVLPQAMIAGKPVVSYDVDGAREVVLPDRTGFLVQPHDARGLAEALIRLATDRDLRTGLGAAGRQLFAQQFRHEYMTERIRELYCTILEGKSSTDRRPES